MASKQKAKAQDTAKSNSAARTNKTGYAEYIHIGVYPYLTRLQVAKFALTGGNFVGRTLFIGGTKL